MYNLMRYRASSVPICHSGASSYTRVKNSRIRCSSLKMTMVGQQYYIHILLYTRTPILSPLSSPPLTPMLVSSTVLSASLLLSNSNLLYRKNEQNSSFSSKRTYFTPISNAASEKSEIIVKSPHNYEGIQNNNSEENYDEEEDFEPYFVFPTEKDVPNITDAIYEELRSRGSGPGGQGSNSSSNKVEIHVDTELLEIILDGATAPNGASSSSSLLSSASAIIERLKRHKEIRNRLADDDNKIIISSHSHRSAAANKEECLRVLRRCVQEASLVVPLSRTRLSGEAGPEGRQKRRATYSYIEECKKRRWKKGNMLRAQRTVKSGKW
eukprot:Tbor_TRINITY_DN5343_c3_g6::TRINITY_DN5343_c3_g6_i1::g.4519::m.4519